MKYYKLTLDRTQEEIANRMPHTIYYEVADNYSDPSNGLVRRGVELFDKGPIKRVDINNTELAEIPNLDSINYLEKQTGIKGVETSQEEFNELWNQSLE